jgi:hypothetical protein
MTMKNSLRPIALAAILGTLALPASAQWGPEEEKNCFLNGKKGTITLSGQINDTHLGANVPSYDANIFRASVTYTF